MNITIIGRKCSPRESFKERANKKLAKIDKFFGAEASAKITVTVEKSFQSVEITVNSDGMIFRAQERADNMNDALDKCVDTLIRKIRKYKTKLEKRVKSGTFDDFAFANEINEEDIAEENEFEVIRTKTVAVKPQSVEEAILQMNMLGHEFYMFINSATEQICVVYKRKNGGYGLLEPAEE